LGKKIKNGEERLTTKTKGGKAWEMAVRRKKTEDDAGLSPAGFKLIQGRDTKRLRTCETERRNKAKGKTD